MPGRDIYWNNTSLLVNGNTATGSGGWDAGPNRLSVTENGSPRKDAASPFQSAPGYWSNSFDGSGDYLTLPSRLGIGTGDFTFECWYYALTSSNMFLFTAHGAGGGWDASSGTGLAISTGGFQTATTDENFGLTPTVLNKWTHVAVTRSSGTLKMFINGTSVYSGTITENIDGGTATGTPSIGIWDTFGGTARGFFNGYISNLRVLVGTALYTSTFTPPTTALTAISGTSLLTCQDNRFKDNSTNNFTLTAAGNVSVEPESPFRGGSVYFEGGFGGNWLSIPNSTNLQLGTGDFTIELWVKVNLGLGQGILSRGSPGWALTVSNASVLNFAETAGTVSSGVTTISGSKWNHVAIVRSGTSTGNIKMYLNGVLVATSSFASTTNFNESIPLLIGTDVSTGSPYSGYISNVRILKGTALYTSTFTPPGNELTPIENTVLLTCQSPTQLIDYSVTNSPVTSTGSKAAVSNAGPGLLSRKNSVYFNGNFISFNNTAWGTQDYTVEFWAYGSNVGNPNFFDTRNYFGPGDSGVGLAYYIFGGQIYTDKLGNTGVTFPVWQWNHLVACRSSGTLRLYLNGTLIQSGSDTTNYGAYKSSIGSQQAYQYFNGYISNFRAVVGTALYTGSTLTIPNQPLEAISGTVILTCQSETIEDTGPNNLPITITGTPFTSQFNPYDLARSTYGSVLVGDGSYISTQSSNNITIGTGDFTFECWVNSFNAGATSAVFQILVGTTNSLWVYSNYGTFNVAVNGTPKIENGGSLRSNEWNHVAVTRQSGTMMLYVNGVASGTYTSSENFDTTIHRIGFPTSFIYNGLVSNSRFTNGVARYTSNFTPSLTHFQPDSQTTALLAGTSEITPRNKACFVDGSSNKLAITGYGNATQSTFSPYTTRNGQDYSPSVNGGSAYFDGGGDYLTVSSSSGFAFGTGDYTVEGWYNLSSNYPFYPRFFTMSNLDISIEGSTSTTATIFVRTGGSILTYAVPNEFGKWYHLAIVRKSGVLRVYQNGIKIGFDAANTTNITSTSAAIGGYTGATVNEYLYGYISDLRVVKGAAVYQANFPVPTQPVGLYSLNNATTTLYLPFTSASIIDETGKGAIEPFGDVKSSTLIKNYNNTSMYFDGNGDYLTVNAGDRFNFGTGDWTIETRFYINGDSSPNNGSTRDAALFDLGLLNEHQFGIYISGNTSTTGTGLYTLKRPGGPDLSASGGVNIPQKTWHHVALSKSSNTFRYFLNGLQVGSSISDTNSWGSSTLPLLIGRGSESGYVSYFNGYIDDLRITKGIARYTANFIPSTASFPTAEVYTQPVVTNYQDNGSDLGTKYVTKSYLMDWYPDLIPAYNNGVLYSWGYNASGTLGDGTKNNKSSPTVTLGGASWKQITTGYANMAGVKSDGTLWAWGSNGGGNRSNGDGTYSSRTSPVQVAGGGTNWKSISIGQEGQFIALKTDGTLWSWGYNNFGLLFDGTIYNSRNSPTSSTYGSNWKQVSCGNQYSTAIKTDGTLWACGDNTYGQLGDGSTTQRISPVTPAGGGTNWKQVSAKYSHTMAIKTDGTLWGWGLGNNGRTGTGTTSTYSSPVQVAGGGTDWKTVSCGNVFSAAIKQDGTLWTWGNNPNGQLGDGTTTDRLSPVSIAGGGTNWKDVSSGSNSGFAIKTDGTLWTWGFNDYGQLGSDSTISRLSPVTTVFQTTGWKSVSSYASFTVGIVDSSL